MSIFIFSLELSTTFLTSLLGCNMAIANTTCSKQIMCSLTLITVCLSVHSTSIHPVDHARNLQDILESCLSLLSYMQSIAKSKLPSSLAEVTVTASQQFFLSMSVSFPYQSITYMIIEARFLSIFFLFFCGTRI